MFLEQAKFIINELNIKKIAKVGLGLGAVAGTSKLGYDEVSNRNKEYALRAAMTPRGHEYRKQLYFMRNNEKAKNTIGRDYEDSKIAKKVSDIAYNFSSLKHKGDEWLGDLADEYKNKRPSVIIKNAPSKFKKWYKAKPDTATDKDMDTAEKLVTKDVNDKYYRNK